MWFYYSLAPPQHSVSYIALVGSWFELVYLFPLQDCELLGRWDPVLLIYVSPVLGKVFGFLFQL